MEEKIMHFANFNITFGEKQEAMLTHFEDVIFPAFTGQYKRGKKDAYPIFMLSNVEIKESKDGEYILAGNYVKETEYTVRTTMQDGVITSSPSNVPTAPYSRFIIFLKNHRMVLVKNESSSPDIRSFQATIKSIIGQYVRNTNVQRKKDKKNSEDLILLPHALVNIVDIPFEEDIELILRDVAKINWVNLRFFPLNNDDDFQPVSASVRSEMDRMRSRTANVKFNSPESKTEIKKLIVENAGQVEASMLVTNREGENQRIKEGSFSSNKKIPFAGNIEGKDDDMLISRARGNSVINVTSKANQSLYDTFKAKIINLIS